jgi:hypothetical protein
MTKLELIDALKDVADDTEIVVSKDSEGNAFGKLHQVTTGRFVAGARRGGSNVEILDDYSTDGEPCIVLWP